MEKKKLLITALVVAILLILPSSVFAGEETINLYTNQTFVASSNYSAYDVRAKNVYNYLTSERKVYAELWSYVPYLDEKGVLSKSHLVDKGETYNSGWITRGVWATWDLDLNPQYWLTSGCRAVGTFEYAY